MTLSFKQVRYFIATAESGQVSQAAVSLNVSQSAVTAAIKQLEHDLGVSLFRRHPAGMDLSAEGARFLNHARNVMAAVNAAIHSPLTEDKTLAGRLRIGVTYTVAGYFLPRHLTRFMRSFPRIKLELHELPRAQIETGLRQGAFDLAVMLTSNLADRDHLAFETLMRSKRRLWLPLHHRLLEEDTITLAHVAAEPYVMLSVDEANQTASRYWQGSGLEPNPIFTTTSVEAVRSMVADGLGVTILSDMVYRPWSLEGQRIEQRTLAADIPSMDVGLAWARHHDFSPAADAFRSYLSLSFGGGLA